MQAYYYIIVVFLLILFIYIHRQKYGKVLTSMAFLNYIWLLTYVIHLFNFFGFFPINDTVLLCTGIFIVTANLTFFVGKKRDSYAIIDDYEINTEMYYASSKYKIIALLSLTSWIFSYSRLIRSTAIIMSEGMAALRTLTYMTDFYTTVERLAYQYFIQPLFTISIIMAVQILLIKEKKNYWFAAVALINAFCYSALFAGRALFLQFCVYMLVLLLVKNGGSLKQILLSQKKVVISISFIIIPLMIVSSLRVSRDWGILGETFFYLTGGPTFLSQLIDLDILKEGVLMGRGCIGGIYDTFGFVYKILGGQIDLVSQIYSDYASDYFYVTPTEKTNFTATCLATGLLDFGYLGVVFIGVIYGAVFALVENLYSIKRNLFTLSLLMYMYYIGYESIENYTFKSTVVVFIIIYLWIFLKPRSHNV